MRVFTRYIKDFSWLILALFIFTAFVRLIHSGGY